MANAQYIKQSVTADSTSAGIVTVASTTGFRIGTTCYLNGTALPTLQVIVVAIPSATTLFCRATSVVGYGGSDLSAYTLAASSSITQPFQPVDGHDDAVVSNVLDATTGILVPETTNGAGTAGQGAPNTLANAWPVEITDGTNVLGTTTHPLNVNQESWQLDMTAANAKVIATSTVDASVALTAGFWRMFVSGQPAHINVGGAALTTHPLYPIGGEDAPTYRPVQTVHAILDAGTGFVFFVPAVVKLT